MSKNTVVTVSSSSRRLLCGLVLTVAATSTAQVAPTSIELKGLRPINVEVSEATYRGKPATRLTTHHTKPVVARSEQIAIVPDLEFRDGAIDVDVAGALVQGASGGARGFIGLAFDVTEGGERFKAFYIRPTNGRATDQLRRNHATQYISHPEHPWERLRKEEPGVYESYADMESGAWTHLRIVVEGTRAFLHVNGAEQPSLVVMDLKHAPRGGSIALWMGAETDGYFANLRVERR